MKKIGTLNIHLSRTIAAMGHTDRLVICDSGLPIPRQREVVDLALTTNIPRFVDVLDVVLEELEVEHVVVASELEDRSNDLYRQLLSRLREVEVKQVPHEVFKEMLWENGNITFVRTGEATPYANVILYAGVTFG
jgi:D-ribose pyranase